jgi:hypothetical protein
MRAVYSKWWDSESHVDERTIAPLEHELTMRLERAHLLAERAQRSNDAVQHDIDRAVEIANEILVRVNAKGRPR